MQVHAVSAMRRRITGITGMNNPVGAPARRDAGTTRRSAGTGASSPAGLSTAWDETDDSSDFRQLRPSPPVDKPADDNPGRSGTPSSTGPLQLLYQIFSFLLWLWKG